MPDRSTDIIDTVAKALYNHSNPDGPSWDLAHPEFRQFKREQAMVVISTLETIFIGWPVELDRDRPIVVVEGSHSRACGIRKHDHGMACHSNCPTCGGRRG